jgi:hypothetical protein
MELVKCPACGRDVSPAALTCPGCGHPLKSAPPSRPPPPPPPPKSSSSGCMTLLVGGIALFFFFVLLGTCTHSTPKAVTSSPAPRALDPAAERKAWLSTMENPGNSASTRLRYANSLIRSAPDSVEGKRAKELLPSLEKAAQEEAAARAERATLGHWTYNDQSDELTGKPYKFASVSSEETFEFDFPYAGPQHAQLLLRSHPRHGKDLMLQIERGQILCSSYSCPIVVVFDDEKPIRFEGKGPADNSTETVFIPAYSTFVQRMPKAKTVRIAFTAFQEGNRVVEFKVMGFDPARMK